MKRNHSPSQKHQSESMDTQHCKNNNRIVAMLSAFTILTVIFAYSLLKYSQQMSPATSSVYDSKRLSEFNFLIDTYFLNCSTKSDENQLKYNCNITRDQYPEFLYGVFHKELITSFLRLSLMKQKFPEEGQKIQKMFNKGQHVHEIVVDAYEEWLEIHKPNKNISVEQMYADIVDLSREVFDIIEHYPQKYREFIEVLKQVDQLEVLEQKVYINKGAKNESQFAEDFLKILEKYFGQCLPIEKCSISKKQFVYLMKDLFFYTFPIGEVSEQNETILIDETLDFDVTNLLIDEMPDCPTKVQGMVSFQEIDELSNNLKTSIFEFILSNLKESERETIDSQESNEADLGQIKDVQNKGQQL